MTTITTTCASCGRALAIPERYLDRDLKCPDCGHPVRVASAGAAPSRAPEPIASAPVFPDSAVPGPGALAAPPFEDPAAAPLEDGALPTAAVYWRVRRIGALSAAATSAVIYALLGLFLGLMVAAVSLVSPVVAIPFLRGRILGALAVVVLPLAYAAIGFVAGLVGAAVYNLAARLVGGIKLVLE